MDNRSSSSSPDPLGYPGDPEYLLSSARKPFPSLPTKPSPRRRGTPRYQSPLKPANFSIGDAHSIRFDDVLLPPTPSGGGRRYRSPSPSKTTLHSDNNNLSPWRIRVTLEAEREDEDGSLSPGARTRKVPLKGLQASSERTPKRQRSARKPVSERVPTPGKTKGTGTPQSKLDTGEKRKRGRPRKSVSPSKDNGAKKDIFGNSVRNRIQEDPFFDVAMVESGGGGTLRKPSSVETVENDMDATMLDQAVDNSPIANETNLSSQPGFPIKKHGLPNHKLDSSPSVKPPAAKRRRGVSPENTIDAGHTPGPTRFRNYPTPTSSSLLEDEGPVAETQYSAPFKETQETDHRAPGFIDPTEVHREFDSIMESEGFSMVSLDTLPSAQQRLNNSFNQTAISNYIPKERSLLAQEESSAEEIVLPHPSSALPSETNNVAESQSAPVQSPYGVTSQQKHDDTQQKRTPPKTHISPLEPPPPPPARQSPKRLRRKPLSRLARVVRAGIALQGVLSRRQSNTKLQSPFSSPGYPRQDGSEAARQRLDELFGDFGVETQRELRAGLRFGEELAKRLRVAEDDRQKQQANDLPGSHGYAISDESDSEPAPEVNGLCGSEANVQTTDDHNWMSITSQHPQQPSTPDNRGDAPKNSERKFSSEMARCQAEWQAEREAISREIQMANSSQVIIISSDEDEHSPYREHNHAMDSEHRADEEEEYDDIWQQEARDEHDEPSLPPPVDIAHSGMAKPPRRWLPSPWTRGQDMEQESPDEDIPPELYWAARRNQFPSQPAVKTHMARMRDQNIDFSSLLGTPESYTRRFYEDRATPEDAVDHRVEVIEKSQEAKHSSPVVSAAHQLVSRTLYPETPAYPTLPPVASPETSDRHEEPAEQQEPPENMEPSNLSSRSSSASKVLSRLQHASEEPTNVVQPTVSDDEVSNHAANPQDAKATPEASAHPEAGGPPSSSWFRKLTDLAPSWLSKQRSSGEQQDERTEQTRAPTQSTDGRHGSTVVERPDRSRTIQKPYSPSQRRHQKVPRTRQLTKTKSNSRKAVKPLATSGFFTDDHYVALRHLYRKAKATPNSFPYAATPDQEAIVGLLMVSADGAYSRPVTEMQLAIVDKFRRNLAEGSKHRGGTGYVEWSDEELVRRLFSIMVGEQIRNERKRQHRFANGVRQTR